MTMTMMKTVTAPNNRRGICEPIRNNPSSHLKKINKEVDIALGDTQ
jgi:hypothetical protein